MKSWILAVSLLITNMAMGQTIAEGLHFIDRDQPSRAKQVFEDAFIDETAYGFLLSEDEAAFKNFLTHRASLISTDICRRLNLYPGA